MMKTSITFVLAFIFCWQLTAQKYFTRTGQITFESKTDLEDIEAINRSTVSIIDLEDGKIEFSVLIKGFVFEKALMQEHFNENYMESSKYPKAIFKGTIVDFDKDMIATDGQYPITVKGTLQLHNVEKEIEVKGTLTKNGEELIGESTFNLTVADFDIEIPSVVRDNIAKEVKVKVKCDYIPLKK